MPLWEASALHAREASAPYAREASALHAREAPTLYAREASVLYTKEAGGTLAQPCFIEPPGTCSCVTAAWRRVVRGVQQLSHHVGSLAGRI
eukprot:365082-Chlamydomonas_euryale.AAC.11